MVVDIAICDPCQAYFDISGLEHEFSSLKVFIVIQYLVSLYQPNKNRVPQDNDMLNPALICFRL